ncbi:B-cell lymphoma/leukemia 10 isoform X3 [Hirundo rustica]|uniref:B-cell lymphoma/leukemia 10 isoform X3 n=1 Tax=Hirundo rustica TaxID=43150 RepID=UPI001A94F1E2|nr:B-cell lymphoma/leukemia 10 isoform X3 [Hirundo rustica]
MEGPGSWSSSGGVGRPLTEDEMAEVKKDALERMRPYLCDKIIAERHFDYLRSKKILTREDTEEISARSSSRKKTGKLLDYLAENPKGLDTLIESIRRERTQNFLLQKITDVVLKVKNEKLEALKGLEVLLTPKPCSHYVHSYFKAEEENTGFLHQKHYFLFYTHQKANKEGRSTF